MNNPHAGYEVSDKTTLDCPVEVTLLNKEGVVPNKEEVRRH
jgi:hypothetical protein